MPKIKVYCSIILPPISDQVLQDKLEVVLEERKAMLDLLSMALLNFGRKEEEKENGIYAR